MHLTSSPAVWYAIRASGIVAYVLLTAAVAIGLAVSGRERIDGWPRFAVDELHRYAGAVASVFLALHVLASMVDSWAGISLEQLVLPFARGSSLGLGLGVVSLELLVAVGVATTMRDRLSHRAWLRLHRLNLAVWAFAAVHGIAMGTDSWQPLAAGLYAVSILLVGALLWRRLEARPAARPGTTPR